MGTKVIAIGSDLFSALDEYGYNPQNDVITSSEFERMLSSDGFTEGKILKISDKKPPETISIIQYVGPPDHQHKLQDILALKYLNYIEAKNPNCKVNIFYDLSKIRKMEDFLLRSLDSRIHYPNKIKILEKNGQKIVKADSKEFPSELIILNQSLVPNKDLKAFRKTMDFTLDDYGFMSEDTLASGIYGVGTIFGPLDYKSTISTANNTALKIISLLSNDYLIAEFSGIEIDDNKCGLCGLCSKICPYNAITIESEKVSIDKFKCKGCGTCASICPTNAIDLNIDNSEKILKSIEIFSKFRKQPKIIAFCCRSCGYAAADDAGLKKISYNPNIFILSVPCTGRIDTNFIIKSFEFGFDGVMIIGCRKNACRYIDGVEKVEKKIVLLQNIIPMKYRERIILTHMNAVEGNKFAEEANKFYKKLSEEVKFET
ncbi:MAG: hydrogenase iron-sulfur subunit [Candidatus Thorarchaeota archaeon]